jgi:ABC-type polar amino acid transport system ATPase subunit
MTMLIVTHEIRLATSVGQRLFFMDRGVILESGKPADLVNNPGTERLRSFLNAHLH